MTGVKFNSTQSIIVWLLHITQFIVCATKNLTDFVADSHDVSSDRAWLPYREPCMSCQHGEFFYWNTAAGNNSSTDVSLSGKMWKSNANNILISQVGLSECQTTRYSEEFPDCAITYHHVSTQPSVRAAKHHRNNADLTAMFGHYIGGYFNNKIRLQSQIDFTANHW